MSVWISVLLGTLGVCTVAALWWALTSGEAAAWAIFFSLGSMDVSASSWAARRRKQRSARER